MSELINNREYRQMLLKDLIKDLHAGKSVEDVKQRFQQLLKYVGATEISQMEQKLIEEGMPAEEIKRLCDVHTAVFKDALDEHGLQDIPPGHPVHVFREENRALSKIIKDIRELTYRIDVAGIGEDITPLLNIWREKHRLLVTIERHFSRKENILFPYLEKNGITGPPKVMWSIHDDIRRGLKKITALLNQAEGRASKSLTREIADLVLPLLNTIEELFYKEENILFPMCQETLSPDEWQEILEQSDEIGYSLIQPARGWSARGKGAEHAPAGMPDGLLQLDTGTLSVEQVNCLLKALPIDITFVDRDDVVRYFSQGRERIFARTPAVIGRKVQLCHPPDSVHIVEKIVEDFKNNRRNEAEFWIQMQGKFIYIRYFPVRNATGEFLGVLEVTQDVSQIRALEGEKRILDERAPAPL